MRIDYYVSKNRGVTMIELLMVIAIVAILASVSASSFLNNIADYRLNAAARDLVSNMQWTKINAIKENKEWNIVFDVLNANYYIHTDDDKNKDWGQIDKKNKKKKINLIEYGSNVSFGHGDAVKPKGSLFDDNVTFCSNSESNVAVFNQKGGINTPSGYIYIENNEGSTYAIGGLSATGIISVYKYNRKNKKWIE
jgi:prepilin-type N-terminal cleavage/methylation domain-containing protein